MLFFLLFHSFFKKTAQRDSESEKTALWVLISNTPIPSSPGPLSQNEVLQERLCTWPHFESEGFWNSEVAFYFRNYVTQTSLGARHAFLCGKARNAGRSPMNFSLRGRRSKGKG